MKQKLIAELDERKTVVLRSFGAEMDRAIAQVVRQGFKDQDPNLLVIQILDREPVVPGSLSVNSNTLVYPVVYGSGTISSDTVEKYDSIAVLNFTDAPGAPNSGNIVATSLTSMMGGMGVFTILERSRVEQVYEEQRLQLLRADENLSTLRVGRLLGAKAIIIGDVNKWESKGQGSNVSISLRLVDVETGSILFSGMGYWPEPITGPPQKATLKILACLLVKLFDRIGMGTGWVGAAVDMHEEKGGSVFFVKKIRHGSPAESVGLKQGDIILSCNGNSIERLRTKLQLEKACHVDPEQEISLEIARGDQRLLFKAIATEICRGL